MSLAKTDGRSPLVFARVSERSGDLVVENILICALIPLDVLRRIDTNPPDRVGEGSKTGSEADRSGADPTEGWGMS
jgi:hypothetical protein